MHLDVDWVKSWIKMKVVEVTNGVSDGRGSRLRTRGKKDGGAETMERGHSVAKTETVAIADNEERYHR